MTLFQQGMKKFLLIGSLSFAALCSAGDNLNDPAMTALDDYTLQGTINLISGLETGDADGNVNVVIEIPKGTTGKWEVSGDDPTKIVWEFKNGKPRTVDYLNGYPANYGTVPQTSMPASFGGDGEPLDVVVLGDVLHRGKIVKVKVIGILNLQEGDEFDGKLLAVVVGSPEAQAANWEELNKQIPGSVDAVSTWFSNYKGPGKIQLTGIGSAEQAKEIVAASAAAYQKSK